MQFKSDASVAFIAPLWLPICGGAETFHYRLVKALLKNGVPVKVLTSIKAIDGRNNGELDIERYAPDQQFDFATWMLATQNRQKVFFESLSNHYDFMKRAVLWCKENRVQTALICHPFQQVQYFHARELYLRLKDQGIRVGLIDLDLSDQFSKYLRHTYLTRARTWDEASALVHQEARELAQKSKKLEWAAFLGSPAFFEPDFMVLISEWASQFVDPLDQIEKIVLHPLIDDDEFRTENFQEKAAFRKRDVLMINPQGRKGPEVMKNLILESGEERTFRVLQGGWGNSLQGFRPMVEGSGACREGRVDFVPYVEDMAPVYQASDVLLFPSYEEGYGLTPVEAMYCGMPVVSSNFPPILEGVGEGAFSLCPFKDDKEKWVTAVDQVISHRASWLEKVSVRVEFLRDRQIDEIKRLGKYLVDGY